MKEAVVIVVNSPSPPPPTEGPSKKLKENCSGGRISYFSMGDIASLSLRMRSGLGGVNSRRFRGMAREAAAARRRNEKAWKNIAERIDDEGEGD